MEKEIGKIKKNNDTDIVIRIDEFGGKPGLTIREYVNTSQSGFKGFTKSGTRIPAESFDAFKKMIDSINPADLKASSPAEAPKKEAPKVEKNESKDEEDDEDASGIDDEGLM